MLGSSRPRQMHTLMYGEIMTHEIIIVGSGIIGINIALALQDSGFREVILLDRAPNCVKVSDMNAGRICFHRYSSVGHTGYNA